MPSGVSCVSPVSIIVDDGNGGPVANALDNGLDTGVRDPLTLPSVPASVAMDQLVARDPMAAKVYQSYSDFYRGARGYHHISEQAYINMRDMAMGDEEF